MENLLRGVALQQARKKNKLSQKELGKCIGVGQSLICDIENGKVKLSEDMKRRIFEVIGEF